MRRGRGASPTGRRCQWRSTFPPPAGVAADELPSGATLTVVGEVSYYTIGRIYYLPAYVSGRGIRRGLGPNVTQNTQSSSRLLSIAGPAPVADRAQISEIWRISPLDVRPDVGGLRCPSFRCRRVALPQSGSSPASRSYGTRFSTAIRVPRWFP